MVEIGKAVVAKSLKDHPELLAQLSETLAKRQMQMDGIFAAERLNDSAQMTQTKYASGFLLKLRGFFEL